MSPATHAATRSAARRPPEPMASVGSILELAEREARCPRPGCGAAYTQYRYAGRGPWTPEACPACAEQGDDAAAQAQLARDAEARRRTLALAALDVPPQYARATLETFRTAGDAADRPKLARVLQLARQYVRRWPERGDVDALDFPQVVIFAGGNGTGKGHLAYAIAREVAGRCGDGVVFVVLSDAIRDLREAWARRDGPSEARRLARYRDAELLVVDEVSEHAFHGSPAQHLFDLVAWREARLRPTILTTNEAPDRLAALLGPALVSRAAGWGGQWDFGQTDYRLARRAERLAAAASAAAERGA